MVKNKVKVLNIIKMDHFIMDYLKMVKDMDKENLFILMEHLIKDNLLIIIFKVMEYIQDININIKDNG